MDTFAGSSNIALADRRSASVFVAFSLMISFFMSSAIYTSPVAELINNIGTIGIAVIGLSILQVLISGVLILNLIS